MIFIVIFAGCSRPEPVLEHRLPEPCTIFDMRQASCIDETELAARLLPYRIVFIGDHHTQRALHRNLAALLTRLSQGGRRLSLANEWFTPTDEALLQHYARNGFDGNFTKAIGWKEKAGYPFDSYAPIYDAVRESGGSFYGINMTREERGYISDANRTALDPQMQRFYDGLDLNLSAHKQWLAPFFAHCHKAKPSESDVECSERMYRVQVAWDSYMAAETDRLARRVLTTPEDLLVVFTGAMHLGYGLGINARFARLNREPFVTILPVPEGTKTADVGEADFLLFYPFDTNTSIIGR